MHRKLWTMQIKSGLIGWFLKEPFRINPPPTHVVHNSCILHQYCTLPRSFLLPVTILSVLFCTHTSVGMDVISYYGITLLAFPGVSETPRLTSLSGWPLPIEPAGFLPGGDHPGHDPLSLAYIQVSGYTQCNVSICDGDHNGSGDYNGGRNNEDMELFRYLANVFKEFGKSMPGKEIWLSG